MTGITSINASVVEAIYIEALVLADAARTRFDELRETTGPRRTRGNGGHGRIVDGEMTCEALRTTTRLTHCLAWLLNHRAWFAGTISAAQLRHHGRLISHFPASDPQTVDRLPHDLAELVRHSERLYERICRLEAAWRDERPATPAAIDHLRDRLELTAPG